MSTNHQGLSNPVRYWAIGEDIEDHHVPPTRDPLRGWQYPVVGKVLSYTETTDQGDGRDPMFIQVFDAVVLIDGDEHEATIKATGEVVVSERSG